MGYWEDRQEQAYLAAEQKADAYFKKLEASFRQSKREIEYVINDFYTRYADVNGVSYQQAQILLSKAEIGDLNDYIKKVYAHIGEFDLEVENMSIKARITRYQALEAQVNAILNKLYAVDYEQLGSQTLKDIYEEGYFREWFNIDQYKGFHSNFAGISPELVDSYVSYPFNGANFSTRLWKQKDYLQAQLMESMTTMMVTGAHPRSLSRDFAKKFNAREFDAYRLLHTEASFMANRATHDMYKQDDVEKYQILATLDSKTCGICGGLDNKVFDVDKAVAGVNMPPFHCFCVMPDTIIASPDGKAMTRSDYSGNIIEISTANGRRLSVTPNHIMLTARGWIRAKNLVQGDEVINYCGWDKFISESNPANNNSIPTVEQIFAALIKNSPMSAISVPATAKDFKGDVVKDSKIDIVPINSFLRNKLDSSVSKFLSDFPLIRTTESGEVFFHGECSTAHLLMGAGLAADGIMSGLDIAGILSRSPFAHHKLVGFRDSASYSIRLLQTSFNDRSGNGEFFGNCGFTHSRLIESGNFCNREFDFFWPPNANTIFFQNISNCFVVAPKNISDLVDAFSGIIEFDSIVSVNKSLYSGHVYDISSLSTLYICNGILSSNCRCTDVPFYDDEDLSDQTRVARDADGNSIEVPADMSYEEWKAQFLDSEKDGSQKRRKRTKQELQKNSEKYLETVKKYSTRESKWSGKIVVDDEKCKAEKIAGRKQWNCDILLKTTASDKVIIHEQLHACSGSYLGPLTIIPYSGMEEASVELLAREICRAEGIPFREIFNARVEALKNINNIIKIREENLDFAISLFGKDIRRRYQWLEEKVEKHVFSKPEDSEKLKELLREVKGVKK